MRAAATLRRKINVVHLRVCICIHRGRSQSHSRDPRGLPILASWRLNSNFRGVLRCRVRRRARSAACCSRAICRIADLVGPWPCNFTRRLLFVAADIQGSRQCPEPWLMSISFTIFNACSLASGLNTFRRKPETQRFAEIVIDIFRAALPAWLQAPAGRAKFFRRIAEVLVHKCRRERRSILMHQVPPPNRLSIRQLSFASSSFMALEEVGEVTLSEPSEGSLLS